jgi:hypothetical protein
MKRINLISLITLLFFSCSKNKEEVSPDLKGGTEYTVTFKIDWNSKDFPKDFPSNAHFSKLIGWSHDSDQTLFKTGTQASAGIKNMSETGSTSPLYTELKELIEGKKGFNYFIGSGLGTGTGEIVLKVEVTEEFPSVTLATMVAPSSDWYIAVVNINLLENNLFVSEKTVEGNVYDAGTDSGATFTSPNETTDPQQPITLFVDAPLGNGEALNATIATVTFTKL